MTTPLSPEERDAALADIDAAIFRAMNMANSEAAKAVGEYTRARIAAAWDPEGRARFLRAVFPTPEEAAKGDE